MRFLLNDCLLTCFFVMTSVDGSTGSAERRKDLLSSRTSKHQRNNLRKPTRQLDPLVTAYLRHLKNPCQFKRCHVGQQCVIDEVTGRGTCVCKRHCRKVDKPVCGTDGNFYKNRCEMHQVSCLSGNDVFDAKHKDCFYKRSNCNAEDASLFRQHLLDFYQSTASLSRHNSVVSINSLKNVNARIDDDIDNVTSGMLTNSYVDIDHVKSAATEPIFSISGYQAMQHDDIITNDVTGEVVKLLFQYLDLDKDGAVGSEELYELTWMENLNSVFPPPCSLFHLLHWADEDQDNAMSIHEMLKIYNVAILHLPDEKRFVRERAVYGLPVTINCAIEGENQPVWLRRGIDLSSYSKNVKIEDAKAHFLEAIPSIAGNLTCHARNHPELRQTIEISIATEPRVQVYPKTQHVAPQSSLTLRCRATGIPQPNLIWVAFDKPLENRRFIFMENNAELHINSATPADSAAYSCLATNSVGRSDEIAAVIVDDDLGAQQRSMGAFFIFHKGGVTLVNPSSCQVLRVISSAETVPGLLRQDKLCKAPFKGGNRACRWSQAVAAGSKFVYAAQPDENRVVAIDVELQRVVEVLGTDPLPSSLFYVKSTDQLFILCWMNWSRDRSRLLVVHAASASGAHIAAQLQPLGDGNIADFTVFSFFVPMEGFLNEKSNIGYVAKKGHEAVYKLNLNSLLYEDDIIDLRQVNCTPTEFRMQPIGGILGVTCDGGKLVHVDIFSGEVLRSRAQHSREFVSDDSRYFVGISKNDVIFYKISESGRCDIAMNFSANFSVDNVDFVSKYSEDERAIAYLSSARQDFILQVDTATQVVRKVKGLSLFSNQSESVRNMHRHIITQSAWYDGHLATPSADHVHIININSNKVVCQVRDVKQTSAIVWADSQI